MQCDQCEIFCCVLAEANKISGSIDDEFSNRKAIKMIVSELKVQLVLTKLHLGQQLLTRMRAAQHSDHALGTS